MEVDFAQWYTDICRKAELVEYASVKGFTILRPYGYAIWGKHPAHHGREFKKTGHENVAMPVLIPESLLKKGRRAGQRLRAGGRMGHDGRQRKAGGASGLPSDVGDDVLRPLVRVLQTYRELPMLYNQWCSVIRWEKTTRPFLRSREFWWQEGTTIHETAEEAIHETEQQLNCYADFFENVLAIPSCPARRPKRKSSRARRQPIPSSAS